MAGYPGFDTAFYPGDQVMDWLRTNTNLVWAGFYLGPAPSHWGSDWMETRTTLVAQGWGLAPVYVGQQVSGPGSHESSAAQGTTDGANAAALMAAAGFPPNSYVYLDIENGPPLAPEQIDYIAAWARQVTDDGFLPGIYCSHLLAEQAHSIQPAARIWAFRVDSSQPHPVPGTAFPDPDPAGCGYADAFAWQLAQECLIDVPQSVSPSGQLQVDLDSAASPDPSHA